LTLDWSRELSKISVKAGFGEVPYAGLSALSNLFIRDRKKNSSYRLTFFSNHGGGGAQSDGGIINKAMSMLRVYDVDVALMWHVHRKAHQGSPMWSLTDNGKRVRRERLAAVCGTFLNGHTEGVGSYAELKGYLPQLLGPLVVHIKREISRAPKSDPKRSTHYTRIFVSDAVTTEGQEET